MLLYSVYYISVGSSTCFGCWYPSSGAGTAVITASGTGQPGLLPASDTGQPGQLPSATAYGSRPGWPVSEAVITGLVPASDTGQPVADGSRPRWPMPEAVITVVPAPDDGCQQPKHVELPTEM